MWGERTLQSEELRSEGQPTRRHTVQKERTRCAQHTPHTRTHTNPLCSSYTSFL